MGAPGAPQAPQRSAPGVNPGAPRVPSTNGPPGRGRAEPGGCRRGPRGLPPSARAADVRGRGECRRAATPRPRAAQERDDFRAAPRERAERVVGIVAGVLTVLRPLRRIERVIADEAPRRELLGVGAEHEDRRLVECQNRVEARLEQFLDVAQVAEDLGRRPALLLRPPRDHRGVGARDAALQIRRRLLEPSHHRIARPGAVVGGGRHGYSRSA